MIMTIMNDDDKHEDFDVTHGDYYTAVININLDPPRASCEPITVDLPPFPRQFEMHQKL